MLKPNFLALTVIEISALTDTDGQTYMARSTGPVIPMRSIYFIESLPSSSYIISNTPFYFKSGICFLNLDSLFPSV